MKSIMTRTKKLIRAPCYYLQQKGTLRSKTLQLKEEECKEPTQRSHLLVSAKEKEYRLQTG